MGVDASLVERASAATHIASGGVKLSARRWKHFLPPLSGRLSNLSCLAADTVELPEARRRTHARCERLERCTVCGMASLTRTLFSYLIYSGSLSEMVRIAEIHRSWPAEPRCMRAFPKSALAREGEILLLHSLTGSDAARRETGGWRRDPRRHEWRQQPDIVDRVRQTAHRRRRGSH